MKSNNVLEGESRDEERHYLWVLSLSLVIALWEFGGAWLSGSLALASDAIHVLIDVAASVVAIVTAYLVRTRAPKLEANIRRRGAYGSALLLLAAAVWIASEAISRLISPPVIISPIMLIVSVGGGLGNYLQHRILKHLEADHVTKRGLHFHILTDLWQSVAIITGAIIIELTNSYWLDPALSIMVALLIIRWAVKLVVRV